MSSHDQSVIKLILDGHSWPSFEGGRWRGHQNHVGNFEFRFNKKELFLSRHAHGGGHPGVFDRLHIWTPACAGMTNYAHDFGTPSPATGLTESPRNGYQLKQGIRNRTTIVNQQYHGNEFRTGYGGLPVPLFR